MRQRASVLNSPGAEVFLLNLEIAGRIVFEIRQVAAQTVLANLAGFGVEVGDEDPSAVTILAADDVGARQGVRSPQQGLIGQTAVDSAGFQSRIVGLHQRRSNDMGSPATERFCALFAT